MSIPMTEAQFQRQVTDTATRLGWQWLHVRPVGDSQGRWRTPTFGPLGKGWPDLVLLKGDRLLFAELKGQKGLLSEAQKEVIEHLQDAGLLVYVWRPSDFNVIVEVLSNA